MANLEGATNQEISDELKRIRMLLSRILAEEEKEVLKQAEKRLIRKD